MCQAEQSVYAASGAIPTLEKLAIQQQENLISALLGENPGAVARGLDLQISHTYQRFLPDYRHRCWNAGLDIREAEARLMSRKALIGSARAAYFPSSA